MSPHTETPQTAGQTGPDSPLSSGQEGVESDGATGEDDGGGAVIQRPEGGRVQTEAAQLAGCVVESLVGALAGGGTRGGGVGQL